MTTENYFVTPTQAGAHAYSYLEDEEGAEQIVIKIKETCNSIVQLSNMAEGITMIKQGGRLEKIIGAIKLRKIISIATNPPIDAFINCGILPELNTLLQETTEEYLKYEIAWIFINIASGTTQ